MNSLSVLPMILMIFGCVFYVKWLMDDHRARIKKAEREMIEQSEFWEALGRISNLNRETE